MERILSFFSWAMHREAEHPSSTHVHEKEFFILTNKYGNKFNTKMRLQVMTWSLVFVLMLIY
jgi:hypothetical protein